ncbi:S-adenosyl-L-methionine-dependent methyltransferase [Podospora appendiculata]|uniref:S-adenosyl-L-methionine-dependent methyltransferase n=1 Tax=Podospora appendiculata TaxID=314037 RepID=A0AAE1CG45_9PEZI|nr:S-adenosyl-L-methionine-dependent methyltransferase [Podospora appendiculata]
MSTPAQGEPPALDVSLASTPCDLDGVPVILSRITALSQGLQSSDHERRLQLLGEARALVQAIETPRDRMIMDMWARVMTIGTLRIGYESGVFGEMLKDGGRPKTVSELAEATGFDPVMLSRVMRHLAATRHITETGPQEFALTSFTRAMTLPIIGESYITASVIPGTTPTYTLAPQSMLPIYLKEANYNPAAAGWDPANPTTFQRVAATNGQEPLNLFDYIAARPGMARAFSNHMAGSAQGTTRWMEAGFYPVRERLVDGGCVDDDDPEAVFLVDIGGSTGHDMVVFQSVYPDVPGRLVVQDLPDVVAGAKVDGRIELMAHDFFQAQPVRGARAYYMHRVLHDWPDDKCLLILGEIKKAMRPGYSRLLINENVIPTTGARWEVTALDLGLFVFMGAKERTEGDWYEILEKKMGFKICGIWSAANAVESLIECELVV